MAYAEPHENLSQHMANIAAAVEEDKQYERDSMEKADAESRRSTLKWRQFSKWLANDSWARKLPKGNNGRRLAKAKIVWWASKKHADQLRNIDRVIADSGTYCLSGDGHSTAARIVPYRAPHTNHTGLGRTP